MRTSWEASRQGWEIFVDDARDPALDEFGFPEEARTWLRTPGDWIDRWAPLRAVSRRFVVRSRRFLDQGLVQAVCLADAAETRSGKCPDVVRPGFAHHGLLGPDWTDQQAWTKTDRLPEWVWSLSIPFEPACDERPDWSPFTSIPDDTRLAFERIAGAVLGSVSMQSPPVVWPCSSWARIGAEAAQHLREHHPAAIELVGRVMWTVQRNYYGVATHIVAPGHVVLTDAGGGLQVLTDVTPGEWLGAELERGTRGQPSRADRAWAR